MADASNPYAQITEMLTGQQLEEARKAVESKGWILRVSRNGNTRFCGTCDYRSNRITVEVDDGVITKVC